MNENDIAKKKTDAEWISDLFNEDMTGWWWLWKYKDDEVISKTSC